MFAEQVISVSSGVSWNYTWQNYFLPCWFILSFISERRISHLTWNKWVRFHPRCPPDRKVLRTTGWVYLEVVCISKGPFGHGGWITCCSFGGNGAVVFFWGVSIGCILVLLLLLLLLMEVKLVRGNLRGIHHSGLPWITRLIMHLKTVRHTSHKEEKAPIVHWASRRGPLFKQGWVSHPTTPAGLPLKFIVRHPIGMWIPFQSPLWMCFWVV